VRGRFLSEGEAFICIALASLATFCLAFAYAGSNNDHRWRAVAWFGLPGIAMIAAIAFICRRAFTRRITDWSAINDPGETVEIWIS
jgi:hypothetical protein